MIRHDAPNLPARPSDQAEARVACWSEPVSMPTYHPHTPSAYPDFMPGRVYQGSSGAIYPLPVYEAIDTEPTPHDWQAVHLENDWIRLMVLPELGGRIHLGFDRLRGYDFFYRNEVIKPALVGVTGPWLSGGVEFNWPQHHRPATYLPTEVEIETDDDGSVTVWCSDHDPFNRMKGMHGIRLSPDRAAIELLVRVHNRTELTQTFLWWANVAARVDDNYQSFFPNDVHFVADHANRATTAFPEADRPYYGIDYPARVDADHPDAARLDWYRNIPVPTSYMVLETDDEFFGGYDHAAKAGFVHWSSREVSPGKKQWTWGNHEFGWAWDRALTDDGSHYIELMAGVHTNNQPDFTFLQPGETKTFTQLWYPIGELGPVQQANPDAAGRITVADGVVDLRLQSTRDLSEVSVDLILGEQTLAHWDVASLEAGQPWSVTHQVDAADLDLDELVAVLRSEGTGLLWVRPAVGVDDFEVPPPAKEPPAPETVASSDELYLIGSHLDQYRHPSRSPETWWTEALRRDPGDFRCNVAMGLRRYRSGALQEAEQHLRTAVERQSMLNLNPRDAEGHYLLGLALWRLNRVEEAWKLLARAGWDGHWWVPAQLAMARIELSWDDDQAATDRLLKLVEFAPVQLEARNLAVVALRRLGMASEADELLAGTLEIDPLDAWARVLAGREPALDPVTWLDVAKEFIRCGSADEALQALDRAAAADHVEGMTGVAPLVEYHRAWVLASRDDDPAPAFAAAASADATWCLPIDLDDVAVLEWASSERPDDPVPPVLLGSWCHHWRRYDDSRRLWQHSWDLEPSALAARNLGLWHHNQGNDAEGAWQLLSTAFELEPEDAKLLVELDQLAERLAHPVADRLQRLEQHRDLVVQRHDLSVTMARLLVLSGRADEALTLLAGRSFQPWEGGEGVVLSAWDAASLAAAGTEPERALELVKGALRPPLTLGEERHPLANRAHLDLALGDALAAAGDSEGAERAWRGAASATGDFREMATTAHSDLTLFQVLALRRLGEDERAEALTGELAEFADQVERTPATIEHFATSLPQSGLFVGPERDRDERVQVMRAQVELLNGRSDGPALAQAHREQPHHVLLWLSEQSV
ncbi:DUF5107 domain-containing protein [Aestuariimicrobium ganziense]|uniref:DUF5107 domain-containing protein n=1 Tax=Aestuariimicrobium ganziense TaxID=2773677 RepID=UPI0019445EAA|nr:DUF5107 domain-containing protein [Aestuariimicrobium ganziense]